MEMNMHARINALNADIGELAEAGDGLAAELGRLRARDASSSATLQELTRASKIDLETDLMLLSFIERLLENDKDITNSLKRICDVLKNVSDVLRGLTAESARLAGGVARL